MIDHTILTPLQLTDLLNYLLIKSDYSRKTYYRIPVPVVACNDNRERRRAERWCDERLREAKLAPYPEPTLCRPEGQPQHWHKMPSLIVRLERTLPASWSNYRYM